MVRIVSIHAFRGEGDQRADGDLLQRAVSIHAFRGEGDGTGIDPSPSVEVSIHAFRGEGDYASAPKTYAKIEFQSTPSGGKATASASHSPLSGCRFNPRLPGGRRRGTRSTPVRRAGFNPRLPGGRRPSSPRWTRARSLGFQSTPSGGKATRQYPALREMGEVSIHAFRGEGDRRTVSLRTRDGAFQSTPSGGKATVALRRYCRSVRRVSIHAFRGEGDRNI